MTNEQLALLLKQIAWRIRQLSKDIEPLITEGQRANIRVWVGEGEPPLIPFPFNKNYETRPEGNFIAVQMIEDFAIDLEIDAELLVEQQTRI